MQFGLLLADAPDEGISPEEWFDSCVLIARTARDSGFDSIMVGQHYLTYPRIYLQPIPLLARLAKEVPGMQLGTGVLLLPFVHPVSAAEELATLDVITGGRFIAGFGLGYRDEEFAAFGLPIETRVRRSEEALQLIQQLWSGEPVTFRGSWFHLEGARCGIRPLQRPRPPVWIGGITDGAVRRAARFGDAWYVNPRADLPTIERQLSLYKETLAGLGKPYPRALPIRRELYICSDRCTAWREAAQRMTARLMVNERWGFSRDLPAASRMQLSFEEYHRGRFVVGDPETCVAVLDEYRSRLGNLHFIFRMSWPGMSREEILDGVRLFGEQVIRYFRPG